ncbi:dynein regulatory complex subunit 7 [Elysia marginata]|uniref:Dynein regulatory complex subunit 7 n=1 Tax=Elysia marginata TaxID=1093978 RepID=A0AAV4H824_9GAST|nr:dynein regulatory complex subunit 7 [Elysia marginata]
MQLLEAPAPDELRGWRVHSWVMVLAGLRGVTETFFIEPTTGTAHPTDWDQYLGIESIWNHMNYYINVQYDTIGENQKYKFEIGKTSQWEYIFPGQDLHDPPRTPPMMAKSADLRSLLQSIAYQDEILEEKNFDLPFSWSLPLKINRYDYDRRFPTGKRVRRYKYTIVEDFCRYLNPDGMVRRITVHYDLKCENVWYIKEKFEDRADLMDSKFFHKETFTVIETFKVGRDDFVREHRYHAHNLGADQWHVIVYEPGKRVDELYKREAGNQFLKNYYQNRSDKKKFTGFTFGPRGNITERLAQPNSRAIEEIVEEFDRDPDKPAADDVASVTFSTWSDEISLQYHTPENRFYGSTRDFIKPPNWWDETQVLQWSPELHSNFELDQFAKPKTELQLYQQLMSLMDIEAQLRNCCRLIEKEVGKFLQVRAKEKSKENQLVKSFLQADEDDTIRARRVQEKAQRRAAVLLKKSDILKDYLEPIICSLGLDKVTNKKQAVRVKEDCMLALKDRLLTQAGYIKENFQKERDILVNTQQMYKSNFTTMTAQDVQDFRDFMVKHMFTAHILEQRLAHLKTHALVQYQELFDRLRQDPRLEPYLI